MPTFTAYIDRNTNRKVTIHAATSAHAREYATSRYGKVEKLKLGSTQAPLLLTPVLLAALRLADEGIGLRKDKNRKLRALGLLDAVNGVTDAGRKALSTPTPPRSPAPMTETVQPVERRLWWPEAFVDETMPAGRVTPSAWLTRLQDGAHAIAGDEDYDLDQIRLNEGTEIAFLQQDALGRSRLTFEDDGKAVWSPTPPAECNFFWDGDVEGVTADSPDEFVGFLRDAGIGEPGEWLIVHLLHIGNRYLRCRFTAEDGPPRFVSLDPIPGDPAGAVSAPAEDDAQGDLLAVPAASSEV